MVDSIKLQPGDIVKTSVGNFIPTVPGTYVIRITVKKEVCTLDIGLTPDEDSEFTQVLDPEEYGEVWQ